MATSPVTRIRIPRLQRESLRQRIHEALVQRILTGAITPGSRVNESVLSRSLGVSQTPVREALLVLEGQGFLVAQPARGFFVKGFSEAEARDLYPVLAELETMALKAAGIPSQDILGRLERANDSFAGMTERPDSAIQQDNRFHTLLLMSCPNQYLLDLVGRCRRTVYRYEYAYMCERDHIPTSAEQHRRIINALRDGRLDNALEDLRANWVGSVDKLIAWFREREQKGTGS